MYANKYYVKENLDCTVVEVFDFLIQERDSGDCFDLQLSKPQT